MTIKKIIYKNNDKCDILNNIIYGHIRKYKLIYPLFFINIPELYDHFMDTPTILLYNSPTTYIMKWYGVIYDIFKINKMKNILSYSQDFGFIEALLLFNKKHNYDSHITQYNTAYFKTDSYVKKTNKIKIFLEKIYPDDITFIDDQIFDLNNINNLSNYDMIHIYLDNITPTKINKDKDIYHNLYQLNYSAIILLLQKLNINGTLLTAFRYYDDINNIKEISYLLYKYFSKVEYYYNDISPEMLYIICHDFKGIPNSDHEILYSIVKDLYKKDPTGGIFNENQYYVKDNQVFRKDAIMSLFDFKYTDKFNSEFNKLEKRRKHLIEKTNKLISNSNLFNLEWNNNQIKEYLAKYSNNELKANIEMAHKYGLSVKPKYLDYDGKYEQQVLEHMYTLEDTIIKSFSKYNFKCDYEFSKQDYKFDRFDKYRDSINIMKFTMETRNWKQFNVLIKEISIGYTIREYTKKILNVSGSRAFFKLYEILVKFPNLITNQNAVSTLHICEAPGKFIAGTNHYIKTKTNIQDFKWNANSLNPQYRKDGFKDMYGYMKKYPNNWLWGKDKTGDITKVENIKHIVKHAKENLGEISFMTSDCGMDVSTDYNAQELLNTKLSLSHVIIALMALKEGGSVVFKVFLPLVESINVSLVYLLYCAFDKISFVKQLSASPYNSEIYIVCENYTKVKNDLIDKLLDFLDNFEMGKTFIKKEDIPNEFLYQYEKYIKELIKNQRKALLRLFYYYDYPEMYEKHNKDIIKYRNKKTEHWIKIMGLKKINEKESL
jgi:23S rRNA U2552 (ribose-2'-O)-methylase RlmE/FtsJ